jgi:hypothetical protein
VARGARQWRGIQGSAALGTGRLAGAPAVARAEALQPGEMRRVAVGDELLGAARARGRLAALPLDAFDRVGRLLEPEEQGAYFQLLRLSWGEGRNFCRVAQRDLVGRTGASDRRLHRILDGLVTKRLLRLLHRDNRGTLYRVYLPREAGGEPLGEDVLLGRAAANEPAPAPAAIPPPRPLAAVAVAASSPVQPRAGRERGPDPVARLAAALVRARGQVGPDAAAAAADELRELLADGATPRQVEAAVAAVARRRARPGGSR